MLLTHRSFGNQSKSLMNYLTSVLIDDGIINSASIFLVQTQVGKVLPLKTGRCISSSGISLSRGPWPRCSSWASVPASGTSRRCPAERQFS